MGAEGKFDLALAPSHDPEKLRKVSDSRSSALNKKSSSTPSLTETSQRLVAANQQSSVAGTEQAASADNITRQIKSVSDSLSNSVLLLAVYYSLCTTHCVLITVYYYSLYTTHCVLTTGTTHCVLITQYYQLIILTLCISLR